MRLTSAAGGVAGLGGRGIVHPTIPTTSCRRHPVLWMRDDLRLRDGVGVVQVFFGQRSLAPAGWV